MKSVKARNDADYARITRLCERRVSLYKELREISDTITLLQQRVRKRGEHAKTRVTRARPRIDVRNYQQLFRAAFPGRAWPRGWTVEWAGFMRGTLGLAKYQSRTILLSYGDFKGKHADRLFSTFVHECVHAMYPQLRHGADFRRLCQAGYSRIGGGELGHKYGEY